MELMYYESKLSHNPAETTEKISEKRRDNWLGLTKQMVKEISFERISMIGQSSGKPKTVNFETVLQVTAANPVSSTWRVSGEFSIS